MNAMATIYKTVLRGLTLNRVEWAAITVPITTANTNCPSIAGYISLVITEDSSGQKYNGTYTSHACCLLAHSTDDQSVMTIARIRANTVCGGDHCDLVCMFD